MKPLLWAEVGLLERISDLDLFDYSAAHCWTVPQFPFFQDFFRGNDFFPLFVGKRVQTKRGILDQVQVPVAFCVSWWPAKDSVPEGRTYCKPALPSYASPSGHRSKGYWLELSTLFCFLEQAHTHRHTIYMHEWSSSNQHKHISTLSALLHAHAWTGVGSCPFWL